MAAEVIAGELGLDLYTIDLSDGGQQVHRRDREEPRARSSPPPTDADAILFFDEADALFGKRSEVRDAHDRYANIEIAYLLQRMEQYEGIAILATNLRQNLDEAFMRRLHVHRRLPVPRTSRAPADLASLPSSPALPLAADVDLAAWRAASGWRAAASGTSALQAAFLAAAAAARSVRPMSGTWRDASRRWASSAEDRPGSATG